jgi:hypothetical protein
MQREQAEWYLFLPFDQDSDNKFHLDGDVGVVESSDLAPFRFHAATGIPVEAEDRGGLSEKDWNARRNGLLAALYEASARDQRGDPGAGARILEEFAAKGGGSPELLSIPLYRAAIERMREAARAEAPSWTSSITGPDRAASGAGGPPRPVRPGQSRTIALLAALDDIRRAASIETKPATPPLYLLLEADILIRLDRKREAQELLGAWRVGPSAQSHFFYDWMLLSWRAGADPPLKLALSGFPEEVHTGWPSLIRLAHSGHHGDLPSGRATAEELNSLQVQWDSQHYWAARLYLDVPVPDPAEALAHLDRAKESFRTGLHVPLAAARLHAQLLSNPANRPSAAQLEEARRDLAETAECAATNAVCLTLLECGERDLAAVARSGDLIAEEPTAR